MVERQVVALKVVGSIPIIYHMLLQNKIIKTNKLNYLNNLFSKSKKINISYLIIIKLILESKLLKNNLLYQIYFFNNKLDIYFNYCNYNNYFQINLKSLKIGLNFFNKNKSIMNSKPGIVNRKSKIKSKKLKKTWKINKLLFILCFEFLKKYFKKNTIFFVKYINNFVFKLLVLIKNTSYIDINKNIFCLNSKIYLNKKNLKKILLKKTNNSCKFLLLI